MKVWEWNRYVVEPMVKQGTTVYECRVAGCAFTGNGFTRTGDLLSAMLACEDHRVRDLARRRNTWTMELAAIDKELDHLNGVEGA